MRKDYIQAAETGDETSFVEKYWTDVWRREGGPKAEIARIPGRIEYRLMAPYMAGLPAGARFLDGGCGLGDWTVCFTRMGYPTTGLDLSRVTVGQLQNLFPDMDFVASDVRATGLGDSTVDVVFSWGVFEHFEDGPQACIREALRVLRPGGFLFMTVPFDNLRLAIRARFERGAAVDGARNPSRFYQWRFTRAELARELDRGGFSVCRIVPIHKRQGALRFLHHELGLPYDWTLTRGLAAGLAAVTPGEFFGHMLFAAARRPSGPERLP